MGTPKKTSEAVKNAWQNSAGNFVYNLEMFPMSLFIIDDKGEILDINKSSELLIDKNRWDLIGTNFSDLINSSDKTQFKMTLEEGVRSSKPQSIEIKIRGKGNKYFHSLVNLKFEPSSKLSFLTIMDFTRQKMKEEIIKDSENRFENIANTAPVMIWIADVEGLFSFVNNVWVEYSGQKIGDLLGMNWLKDVFPEDFEKLLTTYQGAFKSRKPFMLEFRLKHKNGNYEWIMINGTPRLSSAKIFMGFIGTCININSQKEFEEKIKKVNSELVQINSAKDKFFSIISHDLRSPLGALMQVLGLLADPDSDYDENRMKKLLTEAADTAKNVYALTENLLEWSRIQRGKIPFEPQEFKLVTLFDSMESLYRQNLNNKGIFFKINLESDISVCADIHMTNTILRNLISNAIKFTRPEGIILLSGTKYENFVTITVKDSGVGIEAKNIEKLFRTDISFSTKGTAKEKGTGLGLVLCKELVEKQGGRIWVESNINEGSSFYFTLPVA